MKNTKLKKLNGHISITDFLLLIWKNKFIVFPIIILASAIGYLYDINFNNKSNNKINNPKKIETNIKLTLPSNSFFDEIVFKKYSLLKNDIFQNEREREESINIEKLKFNKILNSKFLSQNFFLDFLEKNNYQEFKNTILERIKNKDQIFEKNIGFKINNGNKNIVSTNTQYLIAYLIHNENVDGQKILYDYTKLTYNEVYKTYLNENIIQLNLIKNSYLDAIEIAVNLNFLFPQTEKDLNCTYLYCLGSKILDFKLKQLEKITNNITDYILLQEPELDIPYTFNIETNSIVNSKKLVPNYIKGFLAGIMISFMAVFLLENTSRKKNV